MLSIKQTASKIKSFLKESGEEIGLVFLIVITAMTCFGLGKLSSIEQNRQPMEMVRKSQSAAVSSNPEKAESYPLGGGVVTSKYGEAYHYPWCSGAERISPENKRWFSSPEEARDTGYRPAKNCKGLR